MLDFYLSKYLPKIKYSFLLYCLVVSTFLVAQTTPSLPEGFYDEKVGSDWNRPLGIVFDANGQGYVWEKDGKVYVLASDGTKVAEPLLDISEETMNWSDHGLVGFALHPDFLNNGYYFVYYAVDRYYLDFYGTADYDPEVTIDHQATIARITRYTADKSTSYRTTISSSRKILLGKDRSDGPVILLGSHAVGSLAFGLDGSLLASFGDGGSYKSTDHGNAPDEESYWKQALEEGIIKPEDNVGALKALQVENLNGTIFRIDPETGEGLASNPYFLADDPNHPQSKVWAVGFRNPYKFVHLANTGSHFVEAGDPGVFIIGDVGSSYWEELNVMTEGGQCFGWPIYEGLVRKWDVLITENPYHKLEGDCDQAYYTFQNLFKNPNPIEPPKFEIDCGGIKSISDAPTFIHTPPALAWSGLKFNPPPKTQVPTYDSISGMLQKSTISLQDDALCKGLEFAGTTSIPGFIYDQEEFPEAYHGKFFHADLTGWIKVLTLDENYNCTQVDSFAKWEKEGIVSLTMNPHDGSIYWCHIYENEIHKISYGKDPKPVAVINTDVQYGQSPLTVNFDGSASFDPDGSEIASYAWEFGDGEKSTERTLAKVFTYDTNTPGFFETILTVTDTSGQTHQAKQHIGINNSPPEVEITSFKDGDTYPINGFTYLPLEATVSDKEHEEEALSYSWQVVLYHNSHFHPQKPLTFRSGYTIIDPIGCLTETYWFKIRLTVTDAAGLEGFDEKEIFPFCDGDFVEFIDLTGKAQDGLSIELNWNIEDPIDVTDYDIQKSDGQQYVTIGSVSAFIDKSSYRFVDNKITEVENYYRIKAVNSLGNYIYSNIINVNAKGDNILVFPNPNPGEIKIFLPKPSGENIQFELYDTSGRLISDNIISTLIGNKTILFQLDQNISNGLYYYKLIFGDQEVSDKLLITR